MKIVLPPLPNVLLATLGVAAALIVPSNAPGIERVSVDSDGNEAAASSSSPKTSADGRFVALFSGEKLDPRDLNSESDVYVHDRQTGTTEIVSLDEAGNPFPLGAEPGSLAISGDGRYVAFTALVFSVEGGGFHVFLRDLQAGTTERISVDSDEDSGNSDSFEPSVSADGRYVAFSSFATNLVPGADHNGAADIFVRDRTAGTTERVTVSTPGLGAPDGDSEEPAISGDGMAVAFQSEATNLVTGDTNAARDIFVRNRQNGTTARVSVNSAGNESDGFSSSPAISADGKVVAFASSSTNLVGDDTNAKPDVFVHVRSTGSTERVSLTGAGAEADERSSDPSLSETGRFVAFGSDAALIPADTNAKEDVYVRDRAKGSVARVSVDANGLEVNGDSGAPSASADGKTVAFHSSATNLIPDDFNGRRDVFATGNSLFSEAVSLTINKKPADAGKTRQTTKLIGKKKGTFYLFARNSGDGPASVRLQSNRPSRKLYKLKVIQQTGPGVGNITAAVRAGGRTMGPLPAGATARCVAKVTGKKGKGRHTLRYTLQSIQAPGATGQSTAKILTKLP